MVSCRMLCVAAMSTVTVCPFTIGVPVLHRVAVLPSSIRDGTSVVLDTEALATQPVRGRSVGPPPPTEPLVYALNSAMDHHDDELPVWVTLMYLAFCAGKVTVTNAAVPAPVATGEPQLTPSVDRFTWYPWA